MIWAVPALVFFVGFLSVVAFIRWKHRIWKRKALELLRQVDLTMRGRELTRAVAGDWWGPSVYSALHELEAEGLIYSQRITDSGQRAYHLSDQGKRDQVQQ
jgi:DNA-binding PadR family transcriptional regulator